MKKFFKSAFNAKAFENYWLLLKLHQPIATFILLWPVLWSIWIAGHGWPNILVLALFFSGVFIANTVACIIDDITEKDKATKKAHKKRLLAKNIVSLQSAWFLFFLLSAILISLIFLLNKEVVLLGITALIVAAYYPFSHLLQRKRHIFIAFANAWIILMVFTASERYVSNVGWLFAIMTFAWSLLFDNFYKRSDPEIIKKIKDLILQTVLLQTLITILLLLIGIFSGMSIFYYIAIIFVMFLFSYQYVLIKTKKFFSAYNINNIIGVLVLLGIILSYLF